MRANSAEDYTICGTRLQREMITQKVAIPYRIGASDLSIQSELSWGQTPHFRPLVKPFVAALVGGGVVTGLSGCYVGKASFQGEDMRMYPFFGTAVAPAGEPAD